MLLNYIWCFTYGLILFYPFKSSLIQNSYSGFIYPFSLSANTMQISPKNNLAFRTILNGEFNAKLPMDFSLMAPELMDIKYPIKSKRPKEVYSNFSGEVNIAFNLSSKKTEESELKIIKNSIIEELQQIETVIVLNSEIKNINEMVFFQIEFLSPAIDGLIYNLIYGTIVKEQLLTGTFNCMDFQKPAWMSIGKEMIYSIKIND